MKKILFLALILSLAGCAHVISSNIRERVDPSITEKEVFRYPDKYINNTVILGGVIAGIYNEKEGTYLEVIQKPLDYYGRPLYTDFSLGRFLILHQEFLDPDIFSRGRRVTVAGEVAGIIIRPLGGIDYPYLLINSKELHLLGIRPGIPIWFGIEIWKSF